VQLEFWSLFGHCRELNNFTNMSRAQIATPFFTLSDSASGQSELPDFAGSYHLANVPHLCHLQSALIGFTTVVICSIPAL
jgi:hypothetical protein